MLCPLKFNDPERCLEKDYLCDEEKCAWWIERFGKCAMAVDAYLKGTEDRLKERGCYDAVKVL